MSDELEPLIRSALAASVRAKAAKLNLASSDAPPEPTHIRTMRRYGFRSGEWASILTTVPGPERDCFVVRFPDGATDFWVKDDPDGEYEFATLTAA